MVRVGASFACARLLRERVVGHYLNLPVVEADGRLVAIVDVLKLTYATLEQVSMVDPLLARPSVK